MKLPEGIATISGHYEQSWKARACPADNTKPAKNIFSFFNTSLKRMYFELIYPIVRLDGTALLFDIFYLFKIR